MRAGDPGRVAQDEDHPAHQGLLAEIELDSGGCPTRGDRHGLGDLLGGRPGRDAVDAIAIGEGRGQRQRPLRPAQDMPHVDRAQEAERLLARPVLEQLHRPVVGPGQEPGVSVHERAEVREAVEHRPGVVLPEGQPHHRAVFPGEPARRRRGPLVASEAQGKVGRLDHHQDESGDRDEPAPPREGQAGKHGEREHGNEREAREGAHSPDQHEVLVQEPVEPGRRAEGEDHGDSRGREGHRPVAARGGSETQDAEGQEPEAREEGVRRLRVELTLADRAPECGAARGIGREGRRVDRDRLERELDPLERAHPQVGPHGRGQEDAGQKESCRQAAEVAHGQATEEGHQHGHHQRASGDRPEVHGGKALEGEQETDQERSSQRPPLPEAVEGEKGEGEEQRDLGVQMREAGPAVPHEGGQPVGARSPDEEVHAQTRDEQAQQQDQVVCEDRLPRQGEGRAQDGREQQVLGERERVGERMEDRGLEEPARLVEESVGVPGQDPRVEPAIGPVDRPRAGEVAGEGPAHGDEQHGVAGGRHGQLTDGRRCRRRRAARPVPGEGKDESCGEARQSERSEVDRPPDDRCAPRPEVTRRDHLAAPCPRPAEAQSRGGSAIFEPDVERHGAAPEAQIDSRVEDVPLGREHGTPVQVDLDPASARDPQPVAPRLGNP